MWEIFLATVISLSVGVREPRNVSNAPFDYELSYKLENNYNNLDISFKHDYEREDGDYYNDIRAELNYTKNNIILKEDYKQIVSKDLYQFNSDIRYQWKGISLGYGFIWDLEDKYKYSPSAGYANKLTLGKWGLETENDLYKMLYFLMPDVRILGSDYENKYFTGIDIEGIDIYFHKRDHNYSSTTLRNNIVKKNNLKEK